MTTSHQARKRFGQNFLHDPTIIQRIISSINPQPADHLVEIGPGKGALTQLLLPQVGRLDCIELDRDLIPILEQNLPRTEHLFIHQADALQFDFNTLVHGDDSLRIVGNLPYNISTPLIFHLLNFTPIIKDMYFMLQKEVVMRLAAEHGNANYGRLSIMTQYFCQIDYLFTVKPHAFHPVPKVDSAIVKLVPYKKLPYIANNFTNFQQLVKLAFGHRRKILRNCLRDWLNEVQLEKISGFLSLRPEQISIAEYVEMSNILVAETI